MGSDHSFGDTRHIARKQFICHACGQPIKLGTRYTRWRGVWDGSLWSGTYHCDCREVEIALNRELGNAWDDWTDLKTLAADDPASLAAAPAAVRQRLGLPAATPATDAR